MAKVKSFWQDKKKDFIYWVIIAIIQFGVGTWFYSKYQDLTYAVNTTKALNKLYVQASTMRKIIGKLADEKKEILFLMRRFKKLPEKELWNYLIKFDESKRLFHVWLSKQLRATSYIEVNNSRNKVKLSEFKIPELKNEIQKKHSQKNKEKR